METEVRVPIVLQFTSLENDRRFTIEYLARQMRTDFATVVRAAVWYLDDLWRSRPSVEHKLEIYKNAAEFTLRVPKPHTYPISTRRATTPDDLTVLLAQPVVAIIDALIREQAAADREHLIIDACSIWDFIHSREEQSSPWHTRWCSPDGQHSPTIMRPAKSYLVEHSNHSEIVRP